MYTEVTFLFPEVTYALPEVTYLHPGASFVPLEVTSLSCEVSSLAPEVTFLYRKVTFLYTEVSPGRSDLTSGPWQSLRRPAKRHAQRYQCYVSIIGMGALTLRIGASPCESGCPPSWGTEPLMESRRESEGRPPGSGRGGSQGALPPSRPSRQFRGVPAANCTVPPISGHSPSIRLTSQASPETFTRGGERSPNPGDHPPAGRNAFRNLGNGQSGTIPGGESVNV